MRWSVLRINVQQTICPIICPISCIPEIPAVMSISTILSIPFKTTSRVQLHSTKWSYEVSLSISNNFLQVFNTTDRNRTPNLRYLRYWMLLPKATGWMNFRLKSRLGWLTGLKIFLLNIAQVCSSWGLIWYLILDNSESIGKYGILRKFSLCILFLCLYLLAETPNDFYLKFEF